MNKVIIICGPTGSGKSNLAINLAQKLNTEIISADSLAIYRELNIGTAKPSKDELNTVKHHMIDIVSPFDNFSVSDYRNTAMPILLNMQKKGKIPIICGGTGFYINSLLYNLSYGNSEGNLEVREKYANLAKEFGNEYVFNELLKIDPKSSEGLHPNDLKRVIRALEIYFSTGHLKSEQNDLQHPNFDYVACYIDYPREELYERINQRVDRMLEMGLVAEVKYLMDKGLNLSHQSMQGIGYKEVYDAIINNDFSNLSEILKINTRHYAKRQITFFKRLPNLIGVSNDIEKSSQFIIQEVLK